MIKTVGLVSNATTMSTIVNALIEAAEGNSTPDDTYTLTLLYRLKDIVDGFGNGNDA